LKIIFFSLAINLVLIANADAQTFASVTLPKDQIVPPLATQFPHRHYRPGPVCIVGGLSMTVGGLLVVAGLFEELDASAQEARSYDPLPTAESEARGGRAMVIIGAIMAPVGLGMVIGGSIHNHRIRKDYVGLVIPGKNKVGIAYNF